ncbi:MAG: hypothetical protein M3R38_21925, partial [Actinomycetota bacterium]|nr:hypothetical protein [Actinomycetota bacterium]
MLLALLQEETTGIEGAVNEAGEAAEEVANEPLAVFRAFNRFFEAAGGYIISPEFVGAILASVAVVLLGLVLYRVLPRGVP